LVFLPSLLACATTAVILKLLYKSYPSLFFRTHKPWFAMRVLQRLAKSRSSCSASQKTLPPRSVWQRLNIAWLARRSFFSDTFAAPCGASWPFSWLFLDSPHLLPFSLS